MDDPNAVEHQESATSHFAKTTVTGTTSDLGEALTMDLMKRVNKVYMVDQLLGHECST